MFGIAACLLAALGCFVAGRKSIAGGIAATMTVGYAYGIARANWPLPMMHFLFDAAVLGFYISLLSQKMTPERRRRFEVMQPWIAMLAGWPLLLFLFPVQDPWIQLVGLRGQIFFLPFILIGAMLESEDYYSLAKWFAVLNVVAFGFAVAEYFDGVPKFFPKNANTAIIYSTRDVEGWKEFRIPATFTSSAAYCGMMVATTPLLLGTWAQRRGRVFETYLISAAIGASALGVFMGASRSAAAVLLLMLATTFLSGRLTAKVAFGTLVVALCVGYVVANNPRLQRFTSLHDTEMVEQRFKWSVNESFFDALVDYPMGNGLGGGGTSIPFFLADRLKDPVLMENEYGRILLEVGIPGLLIWLLFLFWSIFRQPGRRRERWQLGLRLARNYAVLVFVSALLGTGTLTAIPMTPLLLIYLGWMPTARLSHVAEAAYPRRATAASFVMSRS